MKTLRLSSVELDLIDQNTALLEILQYVNSAKTKFVITPNAGQLASYRKNSQLRKFLASADLRLIDGWPLAVGATIAEGKIYSRVTGSDLLPEIFKIIDNKIRVGIIGGSNSELTKNKLSARYQNLNLVLVNDEMWIDSAEDALRLKNLCELHQVQVLILALGHPKQELLASRLMEDSVKNLSLVLCLGASVDFLVGTQTRAPKIYQKIGLEWLWRLFTNPKKFFGRYLLAIWPSIVLLISAVRVRITKNI
jgi:N-acetylglucosaminyldiphosphoundecaprenol N-acetyl-beta-D-mannosaminyltransferase